MADYVVEVALFGTSGEIARLDVDAGAVAPEVGCEACGGEAACEDHVTDGHARVLVEHEAGILHERDGIAGGDIDREVDAGAASGEQHAEWSP